MEEAGGDWVEKIERVLTPLKEQAVRDLLDEGLDRERIFLEPALDMRYRGQSFEISLPFRGRETLEAFHQKHQRLYGYCHRDRAVEIVNVRLRGRGIPPKPRLVPIEEGTATPPEEALVTTTRAVFQERESQIPVYERKKLLANNTLQGPSLVVEYSATLVIPPFAQGMVDPLGNIILEVKA